MIVLTETTDLIEVLLSTAHTTTALKCYCAYRDITTTTYVAGKHTADTDGTTEVDISGSPSSGQRVIDYISVFNADTISHTVTVRLNENSSYTVLQQVRLGPNQTLCYTDKGGWNLYGTAETRISVELHKDAAQAADTNCTAALRIFKGNAYQSCQRVDLSTFKYVRLNVMRGTVALAAGAKMYLRYVSSGSWSLTAANWLDIGTSEVSVPLNQISMPLSTEWIELAEGAKADVYIGLLTSGGDGVLDPQYGTINAEFKSG
jgi:hypothetical protein